MFQLIALTFVTLLGTFAAAEPLPLRHGRWVDEDSACNGAPASAQYSYDGTSFSAGHNGCSFSSADNRGGNLYRVELSCSDLPDEDGLKIELDLLIIDDDHFRLHRGPMFEAITIRYCGPDTP